MKSKDSSPKGVIAVAFMVVTMLVMGSASTFMKSHEVFAETDRTWSDYSHRNTDAKGIELSNLRNLIGMHGVGRHLINYRKSGDAKHIQLAKEDIEKAEIVIATYSQLAVGGNESYLIDYIKPRIISISKRLDATNDDYTLDSLESDLLSISTGVASLSEIWVKQAANKNDNLNRMNEAGKAMSKWLVGATALSMVLGSFLLWTLFILIGESKRKEEALAELFRLATIDPLTETWNRRHFFVEAEKRCREGERVGTPASFLMMDIDHFKRINDTFGHAAGDDAIQGFAKMIVGSLRPGDIVGRMGGEEFVAMLPNTDAEAAYAVAERLRSNVEKSEIAVGQSSVRITVSIGIRSPVEYGADTRKELMKADLALYRSKGRGRNITTVYEDSMAPTEEAAMKVSEEYHD